jgi:sulfoxide reductase heme-binding subunit YedZ
MGLSRIGWLLVAGIAALYLAVPIAVLLHAPGDAFSLVIRIAALLGLLSIGIAILTTPFLARIRRTFGRSFLGVHHACAAAGLVLATLHPVLYAVQAADIAVFLPDFSSAYAFFSLGGRFALILIYVALAAVLLRRAVPKYWRVVHGLMYLALALGVIHGNLIGTDFSSPFIFAVYNSLFIVVVAAFVLKRWQRSGKTSLRTAR